MLNKLKGAEERFEEITSMLYNPDVISDMELYSSLLKEQKNLSPVVEKFREYKTAEETLNESRTLLDEGGLDRDFKEMVQEEYEQEGRGIVIREVNKRFKFVTRKENLES